MHENLIMMLPYKKIYISNLITLLEKKQLQSCKFSMSDKNRSKNHESNTKITSQNVEFSRRSLYCGNLRSLYFKKRNGHCISCCVDFDVNYFRFQ